MPNIGFWAAAGGAGGAAGAYELIESQVLTTTAASVTFASIPQTYKHLQIRAVLQSSLNSASPDTIRARINNVSTASYRRHSLYGTGFAVTSSEYGALETSMTLGESANVNAGSAVYGGLIVDLLDYASVSKNKTVRNLSGHLSTATNYRQIYLGSNLYVSTNAVSSFQFLLTSGSAFAIGSRFSLYGIKG